MKTMDYLGLNEPKVRSVVSSLKRLLADYQIFYSNLRGFHWHIEGPDFFVLHAKFEDLYNNAAEKVDEIAERMLALGGMPESRYSVYVKESGVKEVTGVTKGSEALKNVLDTYGYLIAEERKLLALAAEAEDEGTVALMSDYIREQEKLVWMLCAYATK